MKRLNNAQIKTVSIETDMLLDSINCMCVCDTREELDDMYKYAKSRIDRMYVLNQQRFEDKKK